MFLEVAGEVLDDLVFQGRWDNGRVVQLGRLEEGLMLQQMFQMVVQHGGPDRAEVALE